MGRWKDLAEDQRQAEWQQHYDNYVSDNFGGREVSGHEHDEACDYANQEMEDSYGHDQR